MAGEVGSVGRALAILEALPAGREGIRASELARTVGVNPSTASRLLATLAAHRMAERTPQGTWRLGLGLLALSDRVLSGLDLRERARPWLRWLVEQTGETATLSRPGEAEAITSDFVPSPRSVVSMARGGRPSALHA
ncbi:MAG: IclR family transcriptional regulator, partial [Solirubrobacteraceae bacterium]